MLGSWFMLLVSCFIYASNGASILEPEMVPVLKFGTTSYYFSNNFVGTFYQAYQICNELGLHLVTIPTKEVNNFLYRTLNGGNVLRYWSSGTKLVDSKNWVWISTAQPFTYTNWIVGQPDLAAEHCMEVQLSRNVDLVWNNLDCNVPLNFICESQDATVNNWPSVLADPYVSPNYPTFNYIDNVYYVGNTVPLTYFDSDRFCKMIGMELVSIESQDENDRIYKYIKDTVAGVTFWSGGTRLVDGINWYWLPSGRKVIYTSWLTGQPDSKVEHCIQLQFLKGTGLFWNDLNCGVAQHFICKAPTKKIARCPSVCSNPTITPAVPLVPKLYIGKENVSQYDAIKKCEALGLKLVSIDSKEEQEAVKQLIKDSVYEESLWTSGNRLTDKTSWRWLSGESVKEFYWNSGEPNNAGGEECISIKRQGDVYGWNDALCNQLFYYICEYPIEQNNCQNSCNQTPVVNVFIDNKPKTIY